MSLNRFFLYLPCLFLIRNYLLQYYEVKEIKDIFFKYLALSGIPPSLAVIIQYFNIGFILIHNNPSFAETFHIINYIGVRPVGLTNEASFFAYMLFFPLLGLYYSFKKGNITKHWYRLILVLFILAVILSVSRTGLLVFLLFFAYKYLFQKRFSIKRISLLIVLIGGFVFLSAKITIENFNLYDRFISTFDVESDLSTIERYGSMVGMVNLGVSKSEVLGVGIYNYQYYIKNYLPDFMNVIHYGKKEAPPSFNFILELIVELGPLIFLIFFIITIIILIRSKDLFIKDWFTFTFIFALSFQILNFAIPFLILLYPGSKNESSFNFG
jgi:hypothetical protein